MLTHYNTLKDQLRTDTADVLGVAGDKVYFGSQRNEISQYPHAVVELQPVDRTAEDGGARGRLILWDFSITLRFSKNSMPGSYDSEEEFKVAKADALIQKLAPFDESTVPAPSGPYAGVGMLPQVYQVIPGRETIEDNFLEVILLFRCVSGVYQ